LETPASIADWICESAIFKDVPKVSPPESLTTAIPCGSVSMVELNGIRTFYPQGAGPISSLVQNATETLNPQSGQCGHLRQSGPRTKDPPRGIRCQAQEKRSQKPDRAS